MKKPIYQMTMPEADACGRGDEWLTAQECAQKCAGMLSMSFPMGDIKRAVHRMVSACGCDIVSVVLAAEVRLRDDEAIFGRHLDWIRQKRLFCNEAFACRWELSSIAALLVMQYVVTLETLSPRELLSEKISVELSSWCRALPWDNRENMMKLSGEMMVHQQLADLIIHEELPQKTVDILLAMESTLEECCQRYCKVNPLELQPQMLMVLADIA